MKITSINTGLVKRYKQPNEEQAWYVVNESKDIQFMHQKLWDVETGQQARIHIAESKS